MKRVLFILGQLSDSDIEWMIDNGSKQSVKQGEYLVKQGEAIENIYIVLSGGFRIFNIENPGCEYRYHWLRRNRRGNVISRRAPTFRICNCHRIVFYLLYFSGPHEAAYGGRYPLCSSILLFYRLILV